MTHTLKNAALAAAVGALALAPTPSAALPLAGLAAAADDAAKTTDLKVADLQRDMADVKSKLNRIVEALDGRRDDKGLINLTEPGLAEEVRRLRTRVTDLETRIGDMQGQIKALKPAIADPLANRGTVRILNEYPVEMTIVLNGTSSYRLAPSEKRDIMVPAGEFTYQLLTAGAGTTRSTIREKETVTLRIK